MEQAHRFECDGVATGCRFVVQSESVQEAVELASSHLRDVHGADYTADELRSDHLKIV